MALQAPRLADSPELIQSMRDHLETNLYGAIMTTQAFLPLLEEKTNGKKQIWFTSSATSSHVHPLGQSPGYVAYSLSKAAPGFCATKLSLLLKEEGFTVVVFHPGLVRTDMTGGQGQITAEESVARSLRTLQALTSEHTGSFVDLDGEAIDW